MLKLKATAASLRVGKQRATAGEVGFQARAFADACEHLVCSQANISTTTLHVCLCYVALRPAGEDEYSWDQE
jgi:hypothetical protein